MELTRSSSRLWIVFLLAFAPLVVGCQGCRDDSQNMANNAENNLAPIVPKEVRSFPADSQSDRFFLKPGHWASISESWQANETDVRGTWEVGTQSLQNQNQVTRTEELPLKSVRPAALPKGQLKQLETRILVPDSATGTRDRLNVQTRLLAPSVAIPAEGGNKPVTSLDPHEYFFVILTTRPAQFSGLQTHDWARPPQSIVGENRAPVYRVVFPQGDSLLPLPDTLFEWTSTAFVLWDDIRPEQLTLEQRSALIDWIHWGGQLIVNGTTAATLLQDSELGDFLPLSSIRGRPLPAEQLSSMVEDWSVSTDETKATIIGLLADGTERVGLEGSVSRLSSPLPGTNELVWERPTGQGTVRLSGFDLTSGWLLKWASYESFFNGVMMRRPARQYRAVAGQLVLGYPGLLDGREKDARLISRVRIATRDATLPTLRLNISATSDEKSADDSEKTATVSADPWTEEGVAFSPGKGVAAWNDRSDLSFQANQLLRQEAGIEIPNVMFVAKALGIYLLILVPVNYLIFWLIGRLEWAWISVPLIGIVGAAMVARSAQLDIGFARSRTELAVLEMQADYDRGHLSRYIAIYNSLSSTYRLEFANRQAVAAPMNIFEDRNRAACIFRQAFDEGVSLDGLSVPSNQTGTVHSEQMIGLGGSIYLSSSAGADGSETVAVENDSKLTLYDAVVLRKDPDGNAQYHFVGLLEPGTSQPIRWSDRRPQMVSELPMGVHVLLDRMVDARGLMPEQTRLIGRLDQVLDGIEISPSVGQTSGQTLVIAHLRQGRLPAPERDVNLPTDIKESELTDTLLEGEEF